MRLSGLRSDRYEDTIPYSGKFLRKKNFAYFIFAYVRQTAKSMKISSRENFPLYGNSFLRTYITYVNSDTR